MGTLASRIARLLRRQPAIESDSVENPLVAYLERHPEGRAVHRVGHYFDIYHRHLSRFRHRPVTIIEIGVFNGGSLPMWRDYFGPESTIVGVDINPGCARFAEPGIEIVIGDQGDRSFLRSLAARYPDAAIVVDDGGHRMHQQIATFEELYPRLPPDGVYFCEDVGSSYLPAFGGGYRNPGTFIETTKSLIDRLNADHIGDASKLVPDEFTRSTASIHFYDSVVVIEKRPKDRSHTVLYGSVQPFRYIGPSLSGE